MVQFDGEHLNSMVIAVGAYLSLITGIWSGWQTILFLGKPEESLLLKIFYVLDTLAFFLCFAGLIRRRAWAWFLFLVLTLRLILYNLIAIYVFGYRLISKEIFSVPLEVLMGATLAAITIGSFVFVWFFTKSALCDQFKLSAGPKRSRFYRFAVVSLIAVLVFSFENCLTSNIAWGLALLLVGIAIGTSWLLVLANSRS